MPNAKKKSGYTKKDLRAVSDNPELTKADFAKARPFSEVFPDLSASIRKGRGPNKAPTKNSARKWSSISNRPDRAGNRGSTRPCARR